MNSAVTAPPSLLFETKRICDQLKQHLAHLIASEHDHQKACERNRRHRGDGILGSYCAFVGFKDGHFVSFFLVGDANQHRDCCENQKGGQYGQPEGNQ
jgi:hypothetical protein